MVAAEMHVPDAAEAAGSRRVRDHKARFILVKHALLPL